MHIVLAVLTALGTIGFLLWRINIGLQAGREIHDEISAFGRRSSWRRKLNTSDPVAEIGDPRESAAVLMLGVARADGDVTAEQRAAILGQIKIHFNMAGKDAEDLFAHSLWLTQNAADISGRMRKITDPVFMQCTVREQEELKQMLQTIALVGGAPSILQEEILQKYKRLCADQRD